MIILLSLKFDSVKRTWKEVDGWMGVETNLLNKLFLLMGNGGGHVTLRVTRDGTYLDNVLHS